MEPEFVPYLIDDRADPFVVGFLTAAMTMGADIYCDAPITRRLYYQITTYLIPAMAANMDNYHLIAIHAPVTDVPLPCEGAVGTGWTGGVDSMYTLATHIHSAEPGMKLTHLLVANVGTLESSHNTRLLHYMAECARKGIARELDLAVIAVDSNIQLLVDAPFLAVLAFRLPAAVLALQKLFRVFLHSGAVEFSHFAFVPESGAYYELLPLSCFETDCTVFYSAGSQVSRIQKLKELSDYPFAQAYLHPCIYVQGNNCGRCGKCVRTMGALYALGTLDNFGKVFDLEDFYQRKEDILADILANKESQHYGECLYVMRQRGMELPPEVRRKARIRRAAAVVAKKMEAERGMSHLKTLSVIIPAYESENYIAQAVDSVVRQKWAGEMEIIVIDDGSSDRTAQAVRRPGVQVLRKARGGASSARNAGLKAAKGELILLLDADDVLTEDALNAMYQALCESGVGVVFAMAEDFISPELSDSQKAALRPRPNAYGGVLPGCSLIRREVFETVGMFDDTMKSGETVAWQMKLRDAGIRTVKIPTVTLKRRLHLTNTGRLHQKQEMADYAALLRKRMKKP